VYNVSLKYVVVVNGIPIPITRKDTVIKIEEGKATFYDIKNEIEYVMNNAAEVMAVEGVIEILMDYLGQIDIRAYILRLKNILNMINEGEKKGGEIMVRFEQSGERFTIKQAYGIKLSYVEPDPVNTKFGFIYVYKFGVARAGRVG